TFRYSSVVARAKRAWQDSGLSQIGLHECRHTFAALLIAAGVNPKALSTFMGHASISITLDRYGHLFPGSEDEAAQLVDAYLDRVDPEALARPLHGKQWVDGSSPSEGSKRPPHV